jgi:pre-mRNA cleavage complex 2 protein Pcf11
MDWHFRANRRAKDTTKRMVSREWYLDVDQWLAENEESEQAGKFCPVEMSLATNLISWLYIIVPDVDIEVKPQELEEVNIPAETSESVKCEVCLEVIDKFFDENTDEWMLRNAVKEKDLVCLFPVLSVSGNNGLMRWF